MTKSKFSIPHKSPYADITSVVHNDLVYEQGFYFSNLGTVMIHSQELNHGFWALFSYYCNDRHHFLSTENRLKFTRRSLAILAGKFARDIYHSERKKRRRFI
ncbi:hypothetical protein [Flagellimonas sp. CMM7]|uniref:hypothetical protein n=1 Tax=Flagellimonas sp. CMM7 TaxID=2654676 RepID=UPI0013D4A199|nr:hypothetical protein [Flagellimonas sp. CMM7]UII80641.1 hypothetical protein LV704_03790 [Flagellimonas sp. CMM7]